MAALQKVLGDNLRRIRLDHGLTREELASRAGIDCRCMPLLEEGAYNATVTMVERLACALGVRPSTLLADDENECGDYGQSVPERGAERRSIDLLIGRRIRCLRRRRGIGQRVLAAHLGLSARGLNDYERGSRRVNPVLLARLATVLRVQLGAFFADCESPGTPPAHCQCGLPHRQADGPALSPDTDLQDD